MSKTNLFANLKSDFAAGLVVFLVALPLCLGIALASGAPLFAGIIGGIVGVLVVGYMSKSHLSVAGPAAGLSAIVLTAITDLGGFNVFLLSLFLAGIIQLILGFIKAGTISSYFPNNVIEGMLAGIGVIIITKQLPHAVGYDPDFEGDESFFQLDGKNTFTELFEIFNHIHYGAILIAVISLLCLIFLPKLAIFKKLKVVPPALIAVILSIIINEFFIRTQNSLVIQAEHLVKLPVPKSFVEFKSIFMFPDFSQISNSKVWIIALTIAVVASIETLLSVEAADRMDTQKRLTDTNVELKAHGVGNIISSLLGGLPMTSVVVRTSANFSAGAKSKLSTIIHGVLLLISVLAIPTILNKIPLATLAAVLLLVGYKLAVPNIKHFAKFMLLEVNLFVLFSIISFSIYFISEIDKVFISAIFMTTLILFYCIFKFLTKNEFRNSILKNQYIYFPFVITFIGVVFTNLLYGVIFGIAISVIFVLTGNMKRAYTIRKGSMKEGDEIHIDLAQEVSFLNKAAIKTTLAELPSNTNVIINASETVYIAHDVLDLIKEFKEIGSIDRKINVTLIGFKEAYDLVNTGEEDKHVFVK